MSADENKARTRRIPEELFNQRNLSLVDELFSDDYIDHVVPPGLPPPRDGFKQLVSTFLAAFPDFQYTIEDEVAERETVVQRLTARGTHQGELNGIPPPGKQATWTEIHIGRWAGGKLVEHWGEIDNLGMLQQLGVIPAPGQAAA
jgi:predicted ester cyclase